MPYKRFKGVGGSRTPFGKRNLALVAMYAKTGCFRIGVWFWIWAKEIALERS
jgi:hypothetical protein